MSESIGGWTPQQLSDFIKRQSPNDPTDVPHAFGVRSINATEHITLRGKPLEHAVVPRAVTMGDHKGRAIGVYPVMGGSSTLNQAYAALNPGTTNHIFGESYDMWLSDTSGGANLVTGQARMVAIYVPTRERLTNMYINYSVFEAGGTFTYGGYALYGPLAYDPSMAAVNVTAVPQVAITETNLVGNFRASGPHFVSAGVHALTGNPAWDIVLEPGIYFAVGLYVFSVAPATDASLISMFVNLPGVATADLAVPGFVESGFKNGLTTLPSTLDVTSFTHTNRRIWVVLYDDGAKQI